MKTALLSVFDKTGLVELARGLHENGWRLLATGGTLRVLEAQSIPVIDVAHFTGFSECFGGRVKTLHPKIHGGLLFDRHKEQDVSDAADLSIDPIDLVVVNLYPFESTIAQPGVQEEEAIEQIDIGGPSMIRSAAKNHQSVTVLTHPSQYAVFQEKMLSESWTIEDRKRCAREAFTRTAEYDASIAQWMTPHALPLPSKLPLLLSQSQVLRYGENPHQQGAYYIAPGDRQGLSALKQVQGKELGFNNFLDLDSCLRLLHHMESPGCAIVKHNNPCGVATAADVHQAFVKALASDPVSAFGGVVMFNRPIDTSLAAVLAQSFWEVIAAPSFSQEAIECFKKKTQLRLLELPLSMAAAPREIRSVAGGYLVQSGDDVFSQSSDWKLMSEGKMPNPSMDDLTLALQVAKVVKSNAIVLVHHGATVGIGAGQMSRVDSVKIACTKAGDRVLDSVLASDAFFPFRDGVDWASQQGISAIVAPGGSLRDAEVIQAAKDNGIWLYFSAFRHFRH